MAKYFISMQDLDKSTGILHDGDYIHCITQQEALGRSSWQLADAGSTSKTALGQSKSC